MSSPPAQPPGWLGVIALVLTCGSAVLSAVLELLFVPVYIGGVIAPFTLLAVVIGNVALPRLGRAAAGGVLGAMLPVICWMVTMLGIALVTRPEGDVLVLAGQNQQYVFYALLLIGAAAGFGTAIISSGRVRQAPGGWLR